MAGRDKQPEEGREGMQNRVHGVVNASQKSGHQLLDSCNRNYRTLEWMEKEPVEEREGRIRRQQNESRKNRNK
jgi:hypothetical protein